MECHLNCIFWCPEIWDLDSSEIRRERRYSCIMKIAGWQWHCESIDWWHMLRWNPFHDYWRCSLQYLKLIYRYRVQLSYTLQIAFTCTCENTIFESFGAAHANEVQFNNNKWMISIEIFELLLRASNMHIYRGNNPNMPRKKCKFSVAQSPLKSVWVQMKKSEMVFLLEFSLFFSRRNGFSSFPIRLLSTNDLFREDRA